MGKLRKAIEGVGEAIDQNREALAEFGKGLSRTTQGLTTLGDNVHGSDIIWGTDDKKKKHEAKEAKGKRCPFCRVKDVREVIALDGGTTLWQCRKCKMVWEE